jgi:hypothetical protein
MKKLLGITLGIMTALGGFVDLGDRLHNAGGRAFRIQSIWAIVLGTIAIIVYMEMCGRVAVVAQEPVFFEFATQKSFTIWKLEKEPGWGLGITPDGRSILYISERIR